MGINLKGISKTTNKANFKDKENLNLITDQLTQGK